MPAPSLRRGRSWRASLLGIAILLLSACGLADDGNDIIEDVGAEEPDAAEPEEEPDTDEVTEEAPGRPSDVAPGEIPVPARASDVAADPPQELVDAACEEGELVIYESSPAEAMLQLREAFQEDYPCIENTDHVRLIGPEAELRVIQESEAGAPTADVVVSGPDTGPELDGRGLLIHEDWAALGLPEELAPVPYAVITVASIYGVMYNTDLVSEDEAPQTWEDLLDPRWAGQIASWSRPSTFGVMVPVWGGDRTTEYVENLAAQAPVLFDDFAHVPTVVGAGEYAIGIGHQYNVTPAIEAGAPVEFVVTDPLSMNFLYSLVPEGAENPNAAKLFINWINGSRGSLELEAATRRGNALLPGTEAAELVQDVEIGTFPITHADVYLEWIEHLDALWR